MTCRQKQAFLVRIVRATTPLPVDAKAKIGLPCGVHDFVNTSNAIRQKTIPSVILCGVRADIQPVTSGRHIAEGHKANFLVIVEIVP